MDVAPSPQSASTAASRQAQQKQRRRRRHGYDGSQVGDGDQADGTSPPRGRVKALDDHPERGGDAKYDKLKKPGRQSRHRVTMSSRHGGNGPSGVGSMVRPRSPVTGAAGVNEAGTGGLASPAAARERKERRGKRRRRGTVTPYSEDETARGGRAGLVGADATQDATVLAGAGVGGMDGRGPAAGGAGGDGGGGREDGREPLLSSGVANGAASAGGSGGAVAADSRDWKATRERRLCGFSRGTVVRLVAFAVFTVVSLVLGFLFVYEGYMITFLEFVQGIGLWGNLAMVVAFVPASLPIALGYTPLALACGYLYGVVGGSITSEIGAVVGAIVAFYGTRLLAREWMLEVGGWNQSLSCLLRCR